MFLQSALADINRMVWYMPEATLFRKKVDVKMYKDYLQRIEHPIDLAVVSNKLKTNQYTSREAYLGDLRLMARNAETYNESASLVVVSARKLVIAAEKEMRKTKNRFDMLETNLKGKETKAASAQQYLQSAVSGTAPVAKVGEVVEVVEEEVVEEL